MTPCPVAQTLHQQLSLEGCRRDLHLEDKSRPFFGEGPLAVLELGEGECATGKGCEPIHPREGVVGGGPRIETQSVEQSSRIDRGWSRWAWCVGLPRSPGLQLRHHAGVVEAEAPHSEELIEEQAHLGHIQALFVR